MHTFPLKRLLSYFNPVFVNIIIENQILSPINVYALMYKCNDIYVEKFDNYNKRTYRNRFIISSPNGPQLISIPLKKGKNTKKFVEVEIFYGNNWISNLKNTLKTCYGSSAFFEYYFYEIMDIFFSKPKYLFDLNNMLRNYIFENLDIESQIHFTTQYKKEYDADFIDKRDVFLPLKDLQNKLNEHPNLYPSVFQSKTDMIKYPSIIDLLFNMGKYSSEILTTIALDMK